VQLTTRICSAYAFNDLNNNDNNNDVDDEKMKQLPTLASRYSYGTAYRPTYRRRLWFRRWRRWAFVFEVLVDRGTSSRQPCWHWPARRPSLGRVCRRRLRSSACRRRTCSCGRRTFPNFPTTRSPLRK